MCVGNSTTCGESEHVLFWNIVQYLHNLTGYQKLDVS